MSRKFQISERVKSSFLPNTYSFEIEVMGGDADHYEKFILPNFVRGKDENLMEELLDLLLRIKDFSSHGRGGGSEYTYHQVKGFTSWFGFNSYLEDEHPYSPKSPSEEKELKDLALLVEKYRKGLPSSSQWDYLWPRDPTMGDFGHGESDYVSHEVYYFDQNLVKYHVTVEN